MVSTEERRSIEQLIDRLATGYRHIPREQISAMVTATHATFESAKIRDFVPLFVERRVSLRLRDFRDSA